MEEKLDDILRQLEQIGTRLKGKESKLSKAFYVVEKLLIPIALAALTLITHQASIRIAEAQRNLAERQEARQALESSQNIERQAVDYRQNMDLKYVELFYKDITSPNTETQSIALSLLNLMNPDLGKSLATWVEQSPRFPESIRQEAKAIRRGIDRLGGLSNYRIKVYYPQWIVSLSTAAKDLKNGLVGYGFQSERIQVNGMSKKFYEDVVPPRGYEIRYQPSYEEDVAENLKNILAEIYPSKIFRMQPAYGQNTPNFISIFLGAE